VVERSDTTGYEMGVKAAGTPAGVQDLMPRCRPVVSSLTLLNHRLLAAMPPASSRSKSVINGQEEYTCALIEMAKTRPVRGPGLQKYGNTGIPVFLKPGAPSSLINGVVPVGWGEAHLSQIHVECLYNESSIAFHTL